MSTQGFESKWRSLVEGKYDPLEYLPLIEKLSEPHLTGNLDRVIQCAEELAAGETPQAEIQRYVELVLSTRTRIENNHELDAKLVTAASNAISILNYGSMLGLFDYQMIYVRDWSHCRFPDADLSLALLDRCVFDDADLSRITLLGAQLNKASLRRTNLSHASLLAVPLTEIMHPEVESALISSVWRRSRPLSYPCVLSGWLSRDGTISLRPIHPTSINAKYGAIYKSLEVWKLHEQEPLFTVSPGNFSCAALSPDGNVLVYSESVQTRRSDNEELILHAYELTPGGRAIVTISVPFVKVSETMGPDWRGVVVEVRNATYNHDGSKLAIVSLVVATDNNHGPCDDCPWREFLQYRSLIVILDTRKGFNITSEIPVDDHVTSIVFSNDSSLLVCSTQRRVICWNTDGWECKFNQGYDKNVAFVKFVPFAAQLAVVFENGSIKVCDLFNTVCDSILTPSNRSDTAPTPSDEGHDSVLMRETTISAAQLQKLFEKDESCDSLINALATTSPEAAARLGIDPWEFCTTAIVELPFPHDKIFVHRVPNTDYFYLDAGAQLMKRTALCDLLRWSLRMASHMNHIGSSSATNLAHDGHIVLSPDGRLLINLLRSTNGQYRSARVFNLDARPIASRSFNPLKGEGAELQSLRFSADSKLIYGLVVDDSSPEAWTAKLCLWDAGTFQRVSEFDLRGDGQDGQPPPKQGTVALAYDNLHAAVPIGDSQVCVVDLSQGQRVGASLTFALPTGVTHLRAGNVVFSHDGKTLAVVGRQLDPSQASDANNTRMSHYPGYAQTGALVVCLWDVINSKLKSVLAAWMSWHDNPDEPFVEQRLAWSPNDEHIVTSGPDDFIRVWNVTHGTLKFVLQTYPGCNSVSYSPDGRYLITNGQSGWGTVWDACYGLLVTPWWPGDKWSMDCSKLMRFTRTSMKIARVDWQRVGAEDWLSTECVLGATFWPELPIFESGEATAAEEAKQEQEQEQPLLSVPLRRRITAEFPIGISEKMELLPKLSIELTSMQRRWFEPDSLEEIQSPPSDPVEERKAEDVEEGGAEAAETAETADTKETAETAEHVASAWRDFQNEDGDEKSRLDAKRRAFQVLMHAAERKNREAQLLVSEIYRRRWHHALASGFDRNARRHFLGFLTDEMLWNQWSLRGGKEPKAYSWLDYVHWKVGDYVSDV